MHVIIFSQYTSTGDRPGGTRPWKLARQLATRGHTVTLITGDKDYMESQHPIKHVEHRDGARVVRVRTRANFRRSLWTRLHNYIQFGVNAFIASIRERRPDVVVGSIQPIFSGIAAWCLAKLRRARFILEVRDAWPESAVASRALTSRILILAARQLAGWLYKRAEVIVVISPGLRNIVADYGVAPSRISVLPNGFDDELFETTPTDRSAMRRRYGWDSRFVVMYTGAHVRLVRLETLLEAAAQLDDNSRALFVLVGDGDRKEVLVTQARQLGLQNVEFQPSCANNAIPAYLAAADACVITLPAGEQWTFFLQNKFFDYLGSGRPIIAAVDGDQRDIVREANCGITVAAGEPKGIAEAVRWFEEHPEEARAMGERGRAWAKSHYSRRRILSEFVALVEG